MISEDHDEHQRDDDDVVAARRLGLVVRDGRVAADERAGRVSGQLLPQVHDRRRPRRAERVYRQGHRVAVVSLDRRAGDHGADARRRARRRGGGGRLAWRGEQHERVAHARREVRRRAVGSPTTLPGLPLTLVDRVVVDAAATPGPRTPRRAARSDDEQRSRAGRRATREPMPDQIRDSSRPAAPNRGIARPEGRRARRRAAARAGTWSARAARRRCRRRRPGRARAARPSPRPAGRAWRRSPCRRRRRASAAWRAARSPSRASVVAWCRSSSR